MFNRKNNFLGLACRFRNWLSNLRTEPGKGNILQMLHLLLSNYCYIDLVDLAKLSNKQII